MTSFYPAKQLSSYYLKIKDELKFYQNIPCILEKNEHDGNIFMIGNAFQTIFQKEIIYAVSELKKLKEQTKQLDLKGHFIRNTHIFKENLKIITNVIIESIWKDKVNSENIDKTIQNAFYQSYKGNIESIQELDEEQLYNSWTNSVENPDFKSIILESHKKERNFNFHFEEEVGGKGKGGKEKKSCDLGKLGNFREFGGVLEKKKINRKSKSYDFNCSFKEGKKGGVRKESLKNIEDLESERIKRKHKYSKSHDKKNFFEDLKKKNKKMGEPIAPISFKKKNSFSSLLNKNQKKKKSIKNILKTKKIKSQTFIKNIDSSSNHNISNINFKKYNYLPSNAFKKENPTRKKKYLENRIKNLKKKFGSCGMKNISNNTSHVKKKHFFKDIHNKENQFNTSN